GPTNRLVVVFEDAPANNGQPLQPRKRFSPASFRADSDGKKTSTSALFDKQFEVRADLIQARVRLNASKEQTDLPEVYLHGEVTVASTDKEDSMVVRGDSLHVKEDESGNQTMNLKGTETRPALVQQLDRLIEGISIYLDRAANEAEVVGAGSLKFIVDKDFEGKSLPQSEPMIISWTKDMLFESNQAILHGEVTARLGDDKTQRQELICPEMRVHFSQPISFTEGISGGDEAKLGKLLERIECLGGVLVNSFEFSQGRTAEERHASFKRVTINQKTGNTEATGPGWITSWTQDRPRLSKAVSARANASAEAGKSGWNYTRIDFLGALEGNYRHRTTTFNRNVSIVYGPVERLSQAIDPDAGADGELPEGAVRISCDTLQVTERGNKDGPQTVEVLGSGNAQLDGRKVHAEADEIKYDEYKELFTLLSKGNRLARLWQRDRVGAKWRSVPGRRFEYSARNHGLNASGVTGGSSGL
ncbi:MAG: LptA/OstA family protein, partial [Planctomycetaceae bacterium]